MRDTTDYKQLAFKLQSDIDNLKWEQAQKDIPFLKEMKSRLIKYVNRKDTTELEMVFKMMDDWIDDMNDLSI